VQRALSRVPRGDNAVTLVARGCLLWEVLPGVVTLRRVLDVAGVES